MMTKETIDEILLKFTAEISSLNANMRSVLDKLTSHESRISTLEHNKTSLKDDAVKWLIRALICSLAITASLTGTSSIIVKIFGAS